ncbi:hypothetical protein MMSP_2269 [Mycobacterium sp. 012931]|nr:hypothetical protein MMSP_2269 [Mycobacterium sp. 012931]
MIGPNFLCRNDAAGSSSILVESYRRWRAPAQRRCEAVAAAHP